MAALENLIEIDELTTLVRRGWTHADIAERYQRLYPDVRGTSERSVRRLCQQHNISRLTNAELDTITADLIVRYGHGYGRSMMQGAIRAHLRDISGTVSQRRVSNSLRRLAPRQFEERTRDVLERTNPIPYYAPYFGYKMHMDQNEKIGQDLGCVHVALIDGCSRMICGYASMPVKNPILIYEYVFRPALIQFGIWDQLRVDHGTEFVLCIFVQELLKDFRYSTSRLPFRQTASTDNYTIERFWPELNSRVNYPIKRALNYVIEENDYDMADPLLKHCVSWLSMHIAADATRHLIESWNHHRVPGPMGCVPIENMLATKRNAAINNIPTTPQAVRMFEVQGGHLSRDAMFGFDPLCDNEQKYNCRKNLVAACNISSARLFSDVVHGNYISAKIALETYYQLTIALA